MNNIVYVAQNSESIMKGKPITCPCGEKWFSSFDKLFISAYSKCMCCATVDEVEELSENIFAIIEAPPNRWRSVT